MKMTTQKPILEQQKSQMQIRMGKRIDEKKVDESQEVNAAHGRSEGTSTQRLAEIRELAEAPDDPEVAEREYKEALEAFNEKNKEKAQLVSKLVELVSESEKLRMKKLDELSKNVEILS
uniref:RAB6-interacting golgin n=1 Tax=Salix viminalis TaxID=40686 RepID=A0A6N2M0T4_SALVM